MTVFDLLHSREVASPPHDATPVRAREKRAAIAGPYPRIRKECRGNYPRRRTQATRTLLLFRAERVGRAPFTLAVATPRFPTLPLA